MFCGPDLLLWCRTLHSGPFLTNTDIRGTWWWWWWGQSSEWRHLAQRSGSSTLITLLSPVLSILEMGTLPRTKYWTNYATVCACVCVSMCDLYSPNWKRVVIYCSTVCFYRFDPVSTCRFINQPTTAGQWRVLLAITTLLLFSEIDAIVHCSALF